MSSQIERIKSILDAQKSISTNVEILESIINDSSQLFPFDINEDFKKKIEELKKNKIIYTSSNNNKSLNEFEMIPGSGSHGIYSVNSNENNNSDQSSSTNQKEITKIINIVQELKTSGEREEIFESIISWLNEKIINKKI